MRVEMLPLLARFYDLVLVPVMYCLGGFKRDSVQKTHFWHSQKVDPHDIHADLCVLIVGDDTRARVRTNRVWPFPMFHAPIFGGWRKYTVLEVMAPVKYWHIGWIHVATPRGSRALATVQRIPLRSKRVRVLNQSPGFLTAYYGIGPDGSQLGLRIVAQGSLGDMQYPAIPLL